MEESSGRIRNYAACADVFIMTHCHFDHNNPTTETIEFNEQALLDKNPKESINVSQCSMKKELINNQGLCRGGSTVPTASISLVK